MIWIRTTWFTDGGLTDGDGGVWDGVIGVDAHPAASSARLLRLGRPAHMRQPERI